MMLKNSFRNNILKNRRYMSSILSSESLTPTKIYICGFGITFVVTTGLNYYDSMKKEHNKNRPYTAKGAKEIIESMLIHIPHNNDFLDNILEKSRRKICFKNGVYFIDEQKFKNWDDEDCKDIETVIILSYNFNPIKDNNKISEIENKIFKDVFGEDKYKEYLKFTARGIAGEYEDKQYAFFTGERDCGKGVNTNQFEISFEGYVNVTNAENFIYHKSSGDQAKRYSWLNNCVVPRITITNEIQMNTQDKNLILDGTMIKKFASGGDKTEIRTNHKDEKSIKIRSRLIMMNNDIPEITPNDALENLIMFRGINKFVSLKKLEELKKTIKNEDFLKIYKIADEKIKSNFNSEEYKNAFCHLIFSYYENKKYEPSIEVTEDINDFKEDNDDIKKILEDFIITKLNNDFLTNEDLKNYINNNKMNISHKKLVIRLINMGAQKIRTSNSRGLCGIKLKG